MDALVARAPLPFPTERLRLTDLWTEPQVLVVSTDHRLAGKESVTVDDLSEEVLPQCPSAVPQWSDFARLEPRPDGVPARSPGLTTVPIEGIDPVRVVLATRSAEANPLINDFLNAWSSDTPAPRGR